MAATKGSDESPKGNPNSLANLQKKGQPSNNPDGRPRKLVTEVMGISPITASQVTDILLSISNMNEIELQAVLDNPNGNGVEKTVAKAVLNGIKTGNMSALESLWNRALGNTKQHVDIQTAQIIKVIRE